MTITEFLLARIAEDERWAQMAGHGFGHQPLRAKRNAGWTDIDLSENCRPSYDAGFIERQSPARVLAECEAKRRIVVRHTNCDDTSFGDPCDDLRDTASVYADHPDFDPNWRP